MRVRLLAVGIVAPGLSDWDHARAVLAGAEPYQTAPLAVPLPQALAPNERRRATLATRIGLEAARQALDGACVDPTRLHSVFASSDGDMSLIDRMCHEIYRDNVLPSPTVFQNSVHNAVAGYWSIAQGCGGPSSSIAAGDGTAAAGLLEAMTQVCFSGAPVLLVLFDVPGPPLLDAHRHFDCAFGAALLLDAAADEAGTALGVEPVYVADPAAPARMADKVLEAMRRGNPAARVLPVLAAVAGAETAAVRLPYLDDLQLDVRIEVRG